MAKKSGRPVGSKNSPYAVVDLTPALCPHCHASTDRESIRIVKEAEHHGMAPNGQPRTHIVWRRVRCLGCEAYFIEMEHQLRTDFCDWRGAHAG